MAATTTTTTPGLMTPTYCTADFSLIPIGSGNTSYSQQIADIQLLIQRSGLKYQMHPTGTTIEGPWDEVSQLIGFAHTLVHQTGIGRIQSDLRVTTRTDKAQTMESNLASVERILAA